MARYYFDIRDGRGFHSDSSGDDFEDFASACAQCQALVAEILREDLPNGDLYVVWCDIRDEDGQVVYRGELTYRGLLRGS